MREFTQKQQRALDAIKGFIARRGIPPTVGDLAEMLEVAPTTAVQYIRMLERHGKISTTPNITRSIVVL